MREARREGKGMRAFSHIHIYTYEVDSHCEVVELTKPVNIVSCFKRGGKSTSTPEIKTNIYFSVNSFVQDRFPRFLTSFGLKLASTVYALGFHDVMS